MIDKDLLKKVQAVQLDILKKVDCICKKYSIRYYMIGGTLLGAVRHGGFIPWDDDIDIAMFREDYDRFCSVCETALPDDLYLQNPEHDKGYWHFFTKIRKNGTVFEDNVTVASTHHNGIYIDIFPLDNIPARDSFWQKFKYFFLRAALSAMLYKNHYRDYKKRIIKMISAGLSLIPVWCIMKVSDRIMKAYNKKETGYVTSFMSGYGYHAQRMNKREIYGSPVPLMFEGSEFPAPQNYARYLTNLFGDYMQLPPIEKRVTHHVRLKIKLESNDICRENL